jgi:aminoglycoside phosphotransferase (APT) family kinase protein
MTMGVVDLHAVTRILREAGIDVSDPRIIAAGRSLVLNDGARVIRISPESRSDEESHLHLITLLAAADAPVLEPLTTTAHECIIGTVTLWPLARPPMRPEEQLGRLLRKLHRVPAGVLSGRPNVRRRLHQQLSALPSRNVPAEVTDELAALAAGLPTDPGWNTAESVAVHGDAHRGNVMELAGRAVLIDTGGLHLGPWQLDLIPTWSAARRNGGDWSAWYQIRESYDDERLANGLWDWEHLAEAVLEREIVTTVFLAENWHHHPWVRDEVRLRLDTWHEPDRYIWNTGLSTGR